ncbi:hypothetical protein BU15DRAFT_82401 [Melanogaster broomeanus]|nr:hypothetical protein BU15DRAFT_82401 [Melanogaster broomeanus]
MLKLHLESSTPKKTLPTALLRSVQSAFSRKKQPDCRDVQEDKTGLRRGKLQMLPELFDNRHLQVQPSLRGTDFNAETLKPAFDHIPTPVQEWRAGVDAQLAAVVVIPGDSSTSDDAAEGVGDQTLKPADCLRLASALFRVEGGP